MTLNSWVVLVLFFKIGSLSLRRGSMDGPEQQNKPLRSILCMESASEFPGHFPACSPHQSTLPSVKTGPWSTETLGQHQGAASPSSQRPHLQLRKVVTPQDVWWSVCSPGPVAPFIFVHNASFLCLSLQLGSTALTWTQYTSSWGRQMSMLQMGLGDYNMFPALQWLNGAGMRTYLIQDGGFPWQEYESQFLGRKLTYQQRLGNWGPRTDSSKSHSDKQYWQNPRGSTRPGWLLGTPDLSTKWTVTALFPSWWGRTWNHNDTLLIRI